VIDSKYQRKNCNTTGTEQLRGRDVLSGILKMMLPEFDFSRGVRGKYADRFTRETIMVVLDPDVAAKFPDRESVNTALRVLGHVVRDRQRASARRRATG
jgi:hypothetical protein